MIGLNAKQRDWTVAVIYILFIYFTLPIMPGIWKKLNSFSESLANLLPVTLLVTAGVFIIMHLVFSRKSAFSFISLAILWFIYSLGLSTIKLPVEKIHFIEYSFLAILVFRALRHNFEGRVIYLWSSLAVFILGCIDEVIQYFLPNRVYDLRDVLINGFAGVLGLALLGFCLEPRGLQG
ncbi:MAG: VanZ family protein [Candidatus Omnitrophica bacterium]|nr:VanZ family protein [Candidatus Omnitrophota bacterium]